MPALLMSMENQVAQDRSSVSRDSGGGVDSDGVCDNEWARERAELGFDVFKFPLVPEMDDPCNLPVKVTAHR